MRVFIEHFSHSETRFEEKVLPKNTVICYSYSRHRKPLSLSIESELDSSELTCGSLASILYMQHTNEESNKR